MQNALEEVTAKNAEKKSITRAQDALVRRHALGQREGGEGHTSYDSLPKGACRIMQNYAKLFSTPRRPSAKGGGFQCLRLMPPTPIRNSHSNL